MREDQTGFPFHRGRIDQLFAVRQILEYKHALHKLTIDVFRNREMAFDSIRRTILHPCFSSEYVPGKFTLPFWSVDCNNRNSVRACDNLSPKFTMRNGVRQGCPLSPSLFTSVIGVVTEITLSSSENDGIDIYSNGNLSRNMRTTLCC